MLCFAGGYIKKCERSVKVFQNIVSFSKPSNSKTCICELSYDGDIFYDQADSTNDHYHTSLAKIDEAPLAVGGNPASKKAEILDISTNIWTEVPDYPYHDQ